jgi:hypothetical protein
MTLLHFFQTESEKTYWSALDKHFKSDKRIAIWLKPNLDVASS